MLSVWSTSSLDQALKPAAVALGNFDGLHLGHQTVINALSLADHPGCYRTVLAFNPHPREYFSGQLQQLLTPGPEKVHWLEKMQVDQLLLLPFNAELANLSPEAFFRNILVEGLQTRQISAGFNFHFGRDRSGTPQDLVALGKTYGIPVNILSAQNLESDHLSPIEDQRISSSRIKNALENGDIHLANKLLGRRYTLEGKVVKGQQLGRTIGFPTANLDLSPAKFLPRLGVYRVQIQRQGDETKWSGVMNIGYRPTVNGRELRVEVHLFDWSGDLYGQTLTVCFADFLRPEQKFNSIEDLQAQIQRDCDTARAQLTSVV